MFAGVMVILYLFLTKTMGYIKNNFMSEGNVKVVEGNVSISFSNGTLRVITVPGCQFFTRSGVYLHSHRKVEISASGLVSTALDFPPWATQDRFTLLWFDRNLNLTWRSPAGKLNASDLSNAWKKAGISKEVSATQKAMKNSTLDPHAEYGELLAFLVPRGDSDKTITEVLAGRGENGEHYDRVRVGEQSTIEYQNLKDKFDVYTPGDGSAQSLGKNDEDDEICFAINDVVVNNDRLIELAEKNCRNIGDHKGEELLKAEEILYDANDKAQNPMPNIWYLDNQGSFTVNVLEEPK
jgi:hypothetical protein